MTIILLYRGDRLRIVKVNLKVLRSILGPKAVCGSQSHQAHDGIL
jgi:hypothetical protein